VTWQAIGPDTGAFDSVILAGGRASRLGGIDKPALEVAGRSLLAAAVSAVGDARSVVIVGPPRDLAGLGEPSPSRLRFTREDPPFGGPASALGAGLDALGQDAAPSVVLLAADQPHVQAAVEQLLAMQGEADGAIAIDGTGRRQYLLGRYRTQALRERVETLRAGGTLHGAALRRLVDGLTLAKVVLGDDLCSDVDTEEDARRFGIRLPPTRSEGTVRA
jgi:molybdopterin-guanine dinucleotide biosynthesis protein A